MCSWLSGPYKIDIAPASSAFHTCHGPMKVEYTSDTDMTEVMSVLKSQSRMVNQILCNTMIHKEFEEY